MVNPYKATLFGDFLLKKMFAKNSNTHEGYSNDNKITFCKENEWGKTKIFFIAPGKGQAGPFGLLRSRNYFFFRPFYFFFDFHPKKLSCGRDFK